MIISRSPLRVTFGGGGTDLPSYYEKRGGFLVAAAIDKYVYTSIHKTFLPHMLLRYSKIEQTKSIDEIQHPIVREALKLCKLNDINIEITSIADIPAGTGLGSSGSFTTSLLKAIKSFQHLSIMPRDLAELACHIEIDLLKEPIGKQDQYIAAVGGITAFEFDKSGEVKVRPLSLSANTLELLKDNLLMFATGTMRSASGILKHQDAQTKRNDSAMIDNLDYIKELGLRSCEALERGEVKLFGELMHEHWLHKQKRTSGMSSPEIDRWYALARENGAVGGKLIGAGGGGFMMYYTDEPARLRHAMRALGLFELRFQFDFEGCRLLV